MNRASTPARVYFPSNALPKGIYRATPGTGRELSRSWTTLALVAPRIRAAGERIRRWAMAAGASSLTSSGIT